MSNKTDLHIQEIVTILKDVNLDKRSGSVIYSGNETLTKGDWYFLGSNPGGHKDQKGTDLVLTQLLKENKPKSFNEYFEGDWASKLRVYDKGEHPHQKKIQKLFKDLGIDLRSTFSTNICFVRSPRESKYQSESHDKTPSQQRNEDTRGCWRVHEYTLSIVQPRFILSNGSKAKNFIQEGKTLRKEKMQLSQKEQSNWIGGIKCTFSRGSLLLNNGKTLLEDIGLFSIPHLGVYPYYPESVEWIKNIINNQFDKTKQKEKKKEKEIIKEQEMPAAYKNKLYKPGDKFKRTSKEFKKNVAKHNKQRCEWIGKGKTFSEICAPNSVYRENIINADTVYGALYYDIEKLGWIEKF